MIAFQKRTLFFLIFVGTCVLLGGAWTFVSISRIAPNPSRGELESLAMRKVLLGVGGTEVEADVADTLARRTQGLSGRGALPEGTGMLFVFDESDTHGIWMRDMRFAIDIFWLDDDMRVVAIKENVDPSSYPETFYPESSARYVLEIPAGFTLAHGIALGDKVWLIEDGRSD